MVMWWLGRIGDALEGVWVSTGWEGEQGRPPQVRGRGMERLQLCREEEDLRSTALEYCRVRQG